MDLNFPDWFWGISLIHGVWHPYKHVCNIIWRKFFALFSHITTPVLGTGARIYNHPKLIVIEKTIGALFLAAPDIGQITFRERCADEATLTIRDGLRILRAVKSLPNYPGHLCSGTLSA